MRQPAIETYKRRVPMLIPGVAGRVTKEAVGEPLEVVD
jgi:hypothetical protein